MKRIPQPLWVTIIVLSVLLFSSVVAQPGAYTISSWVVAGGGGGSTGGAYGLDGTIGQSAAGLASGGTYSLESGYWAYEAFSVIQVPFSGRIYMPILGRPRPPTPTPITPTPTPITPTPDTRCDLFEPNNTRTSPAGPLVSKQPNSAKFCNGDDEDNYFFVTNTNEQLQIRLQLPPSLVGKVFLYIYDQDEIGQNRDICKEVTGLMDQADETILCGSTGAGGYVVRLYTQSPADFDNQNPYTLTVTYF